MKSSTGDARRGGSDSQFSYRRSTPAPDPSSSHDDRRFPQRQRLTRGAELQAVARDGKRIRTAHLDVRVVATTHENSRIGFVVPRHGRSAVRRNKLKRHLRELTRLTLLGALRASKAGSQMDIVMRALAGAYGASYQTLRAEFETLRERLVQIRAAVAGEETPLSSRRKSGIRPR